MNETRKRVIEVLEDVCATEIDNTSKTLLGDLAMDSLRMVMLLVMIEEVFEIELDESDMNPFMLITVVLPIGILIPFVILFSLLAYTGTYYAYPVIYKYMIEPYYNKDGSLKSEDTHLETVSEESDS